MAKTASSKSRSGLSVPHQTSTSSRRSRTTSDTSSTHPTSKRKTSTSTSPPRSKHGKSRSSGRSISGEKGVRVIYVETGSKGHGGRRWKGGESDSDDPRDEDSGGHESERGSEESEDEEEEVIRKRKRSSVNKGGIDDGNEGGIVVHGLALTADQVQAMMMKFVEGGKATKVITRGKKMEEEVLGEIEEEMMVELDIEEEDEEEYEELGRKYRKDLESELRSISDQSSKKVQAYSADGVLKMVQGCLEQRQGNVLLENYQKWAEAESTYKAEVRRHWEAVIVPLNILIKRQEQIIKDIQAASEERMKLVVTARKALNQKTEEHQMEIEGLKSELDKSQQKAVKSYKKFTDEKLIAQDIGIKIKAAVTDYANELIVGKVKGRKRKAEETDDAEEEEEDEDAEEEEEEPEEG